MYTGTRGGGGGTQTHTGGEEAGLGGRGGRVGGASHLSCSKGRSRRLVQKFVETRNVVGTLGTVLLPAAGATSRF